MRHRRTVTKLSRTESHRKALLRNLVSQLFVHERVKTTEAKAKAVRPFAERLITIAKEDSIHSRRTVSKYISDKEVVKKLFAELSPRFKDRPGGYTRIMKLGHRPGDDAMMSIIELVQEEIPSKPSRSKRGPASVKAKDADVTGEGAKGETRKSDTEEDRKEKDKKE